LRARKRSAGLVFFRICGTAEGVPTLENSNVRQYWLLQFLVPIARNQVIVHKAGGLHKRIADRGANEAESALQ